MERFNPMLNLEPSRGLLSVEELAEKLGVKPSWVYRHADDLGAYRLGKYLRFSWERVVEHLGNQSGKRNQLGPRPNN
jgi:excisionase family DNA binding protein